MKSEIYSQKILSAQSVKECIEMVEADSVSHDEIAENWYSCLKLVFEQIDEVFVLGELTTFKRLELLQNSVIVAVCRRNNRNAKVTLDSVEWPSVAKTQKLWLKSWLKWASSQDLSVRVGGPES